MATKRQIQIPESAQGAVAAGEQAMKVVVNRPVARVARRNYKPPGLWNESPATVTFFRTAEWALHDLAVETKVDLGSQSQVTMVRVALREGETRVYIRPTDWDDPMGIPVKRSQGKTYMNLYDFMAQAGLLVPVLKAYRHSLERANDADSPIGPALVFDTSAILEQKTIKRKQYKSKKAKNTPTQPAPPAEPNA